MANGSSGASALEGLVGGFLAGADFRRQRTQDRDAATEAARRREIEDSDRARRIADEDLIRARDFGVEPFQVRQPGDFEGGLQPDRLSAPPVPGQLDVGSLRSQVGANISSQFVPEGFQAIEGFRTEGQIEDADNLRINTGVARMIQEQTGVDVSPETIAVARESDTLDDLMGELGFGEFGQPEVARTRAENLQDIEDESAARARGTESAKPIAGDEGPDSKTLFQRTNDMADDFRAESKVAVEVAASIRRFRAASDNAIGDQTKIIAFNKLLDPTSVVRESEFNRVGLAGGFEAEAQSLYNRFAKEGRLPEFILESLDAEIESLAVEAELDFRPILGSFRGRAEEFGVDPDLFIRNPFESDNDVMDRMIASGATDEEIQQALRRRGG